MMGGSSGLKLLHVAALPFPTQQGTQAALASMLAASVRIGRTAELFTYPEGGFTYHAEYPLHRSGRMPLTAALRSGPSVGKLLRDARMLVELRGLVRRVRPDVLIAHHVEAAALVRALPELPHVFFAHTDLALELPSYAPRTLAPLLTWAGGRLDRWLVQRAAAVATISPALAQQWRSLREAGQAPSYVPTPWQLSAAITREERTAARRSFVLAEAATVALYAGNLDVYQGPQTLIDALKHAARGGARVTLLLATQSDATSFLQRARAAGVSVVRAPLTDEAARRAAHAAADFAIVVRAIPGGLPIKLLDALARGVACAIQPHAAAGLPLDSIAAVAREQSTEALGEVVVRLVRDAALRAQLAAAGRRYVEREHGDQRFSAALDAAAGAALVSWRDQTAWAARSSCHTK